MILVQNLLQLLSGNKFAATYFLPLTLLACESSKALVQTNPSGPWNENAPHAPVQALKVDTVRWVDITERKTNLNQALTQPEIAAFQEVTSTQLGEYTILALLPIRAAEVDTSASRIPPSSLRFLQYYAGMKIAIEEENQQSGPHITVHISDTGAEEAYDLLVHRVKEKKPHLIIGPYKTESLKNLAAWAKQHKISIVSPWISSPNLVDKNPYYIQAKAGLIAHYHLINQHVRQNFPLSNVYLISKLPSESKAKHFNDSNVYSVPIAEKIFSESELVSSTVPLLAPLLKDGAAPTVFILPLASFKDENYIYHFLRRLNAEKGEKQVIVYGLSKWLEMKGEITDFINSMNVRLSISNFADMDDPLVKGFKKKYYNEFREFPSMEAMEGYDLMKYCMNMLRKYGKDFQFAAAIGDGSFLETQFHIRPIFKSKANTDIFAADYFENSYVKLVEVRANRFRLLD